MSLASVSLASVSLASLGHRLLSGLETELFVSGRDNFNIGSDIVAGATTLCTDFGQKENSDKSRMTSSSGKIV